MPIYEYRCLKCGNEIEVMQKISDPAPQHCVKCGTDAEHERLMSRTSFQLKGGGWYSDLYGSTKKDSTASATPSTTSAATSAPATSAPASAPAPAPASSPSSTGSSSSGNSST